MLQLLARTFVISGVLGFISLSALAAETVPTENSFRSRYFQQRMSPESCGLVIQQIMAVNAQNVADNQLAALLDAISVECGLDTQEPIIQFGAVLFEFKDSSLKILWDGQSISVNEKAEATLAYTMPANFQNKVFIDKPVAPELDSSNEKQNSKGSRILEKLKFKLANIKNHLLTIYKNGETYLVLSGYAYHDRNTYTASKVSELNERAWGIGFEKVVINEKGNREAVGMMVISDSHSDPQFSASYEWQKGLALSSNVKIWGGFSAGLVMRSDFSYIPLPFAFPTIGLSVGKINIKSVVIPKLGSGINHGNVAFIFASVKLD